MSEKAWIIYDGRAHSGDTDDACIYVSFSSIEGFTRRKVKRYRWKHFRDGAIYEYDVIKKPDVDELVNETYIS